MQPVDQRIVQLLSDALTFELTVTNTYFLHARMLDNWGLPRLGKVFYDLSIGEMRDADDLINRILLFDGHPNLQKLNAITAEMLDGLGVNVPRLFTFTFAGSAALAALAGLLLAPVFTVYPQMGVELILLAFIVVILGGMGSMGGSVIAAFVIGIAQSVLTLWMNPQRVAIAIFGIMILVLIVRPRGFFGREGVLE